MSLAELTLNEFLNRVASDSPTPGGGSVAALTGALSAALCAMVTRLTLGREKHRDAWEEMEHVRNSADELARRLITLVDTDTEAYNQVMIALKLPKENDDQKAHRQRAVQAAYKQAALVPMETLRTVAGLLDLVQQVLAKGNPNCITDAGVSAQLIRAAAVGAAYNVRINLSSIEDETFCRELETELSDLLSQITNSVEGLSKAVERGLGRT
ncbi:MAG: cyclodeaminase/cyclohydrolase family protein [Desulfobacteraceae bacterium]|jgi:formiminotetrahydrofolate cyclodeaminase